MFWLFFSISHTPLADAPVGGAAVYHFCKTNFVPLAKTVLMCVDTGSHTPRVPGASLVEKNAIAVPRIGRC